ncbi:MAG: LysM peptidoglycan-binding domain-containing protein [Prevotellaceae bacterium]|jgi:LysM repeat protein|nr:LysM peptidoglycan-binding domain-containing protein [Prevotellaceae bacterium]
MKLKFLFPVLSILLSVNIFGQNTQSLPRVRTSAGTECYVYTIQPKETLYRISKQFNVSQDEIIALNPSAQNGIKAGQPLYIPIKDDAQQPVGTAQTRSQSSAYAGLVNYQVEAKQTLYSISRRFGVSEDDIIKYNPQAKTMIKAGEILRIPVREQPQAPPANPASGYTPSMEKPKTAVQLELKDVYGDPYSKYISHVIQLQETLYAISKKYGVFVEDIINANPDLESVLHQGDTIRIPIKTDYAPPSLETLHIEKEIETIRIAFLLPLSAANTDFSDRFIEFYAGALLAIDRAKKQGTSFEIYTYDTERSTETLNAVLALPELKRADIIIGPAYTNQVGAVADFAKRNKIYTIVPFTSKVQGIAANPYLIQFNPASETEIDFIATQLSEGSYHNANVIFIKPNNIDIADEGWLWATNLQNALTKKGKYAAAIDWTKPADNTEIQTVLRSGVKNVLIFMTDKYANVQPYFATVNALSAANVNLMMYVRYSWLNYNFKNTETMHVSPFNNIRQSSDLTVYQKEFSKYFGWNPASAYPRYDLLGYDLTNCFINQLQTAGNNFAKDKKAIDYPAGIQSQFNFGRQTVTSGFENQKLYLTDSTGK